jgi:hypothetical protein
VIIPPNPRIAADGSFGLRVYFKLRRRINAFLNPEVSLPLPMVLKTGKETEREAIPDCSRLEDRLRVRPAREQSALCTRWELAAVSRRNRFDERQSVVGCVGLGRLGQREGCPPADRTAVLQRELLVALSSLRFRFSKLKRSDYGPLPTPHRFLLARGAEATLRFRAIVVAPVEAIGIPGFQLCAMNSLRIPGSYTGRTVSMGYIKIGGLGIAPFNVAQETSVLEHLRRLLKAPCCHNASQGSFLRRNLRCHTP